MDKLEELKKIYFDKNTSSVIRTLIETSYPEIKEVQHNDNFELWFDEKTPIDIRKKIAESPNFDLSVRKDTSSGNTAIIYAAFSGNIAWVKFLLSLPSIDVNDANYNGSTPLHMTENPDIISALIAAGADVNKEDTLGNTPLMVGKNNVESIKQLIAAGANVNHINYLHEPVYRKISLYNQKYLVKPIDAVKEYLPLMNDAAKKEVIMKLVTSFSYDERNDIIEDIVRSIR